MDNFSRKFLSALHVQQKGAGLEVSDEVVRIARFTGSVWQMDAVRLEPGILQGGKIQDRARFVASLAAFKEKIRKGKGKNITVVLCVSSLPAFTQVFALPTMKGKDFEKAVALNLQMASPLAAGESYSGWQMVGHDEASRKTEVLASFIEKKAVDEMVDALFEAGFLAMAVESRSLALARVLREKGAGVAVKNAHLFINIDNTGLEFLILRHGELYFEYANPWRDLMNDKGEIAEERFEAALGGSLRQVTNFYRQHWTEPLDSIIFSTVALEPQTEKVVAENATVPASRLTLVMGKPISSEWLIALGASIRGIGLEGKEGEVNLLGDESLDRVREEQFLHFLRFWRVMVPLTLAFLVGTFVAAHLFLADTMATIESRAGLNVGSDQAQAAALTASSTAFNEQIALLANAENQITPANAVLDAVVSLAANDGITVNQLSFRSPSEPITLSGTTTSNDRLTAFKNTLMATPGVSQVNLPLTNIQTAGSSITFSLTFAYTPPAAK